MARDYHKERAYISECTPLFLDYLKQKVLGERALHLLESVAAQTEVYIFSGVIRNFLLGFTENRDLDVVIEDIGSVRFPISELKGANISVNGFGGYKILIDNLTIDAWGLEQTWGLQHRNMRFTPNSLIKTAFFNFSSIAFDCNRKRFIYDDSFCSFLRTRVMDVVLQDNPNKTLCVLNSIYYSKKYKFPISYRLCRWIFNNFNAQMPFADVMRNHFKQTFVSNDTIQWFYSVIRDVLKGKAIDKSQSLYIDYIQRIINVTNIEPDFQTQL